MSVPSLSILMITEADPVHLEGGAERVVQEESRHLLAQGHAVTVLTRRAHDSFPLEESIGGVHVARYPAPAGKSPAALSATMRSCQAVLSGLMARQKFDVANVMQPIGGAAALPVLRRQGLPVIYTFLSPWSQEYVARQTRRRHDLVGRAWTRLNSAARQRIERNVLRGCAAVRTLSGFSITQLEEIHGFNREQATVIPGGVDVQRFCLQERDKTRLGLGLPRSPVLLTVRNLEPRMGIDLLLDAMPAVLREHPDVTLLIGGSGPLRQKLEEQIAALNLAQNVRMLGYVSEEELPRYYGCVDAFVIPTRSLEGFGLVTVEALACGTPVLGTPIGSTPEILGQLDPRLLFRDATPPAIAEGLNRWLLEGRSWCSPSQCRTLVEREYTWPGNVTRLVDLYRRVIQP
ncbi:MAG TPA: glycosyltransferase family 4 protein [Candidatus Xenobia bacterium]